MNYCGGEGAEIVYALRNNDTLAKMALNNIGAAGQLMRKIYQRRLPENPNKDYYYILRETGNKTEPILVEYGFIDNVRDANKLKNNLLDYVEGVVKAIADYTNTPYSQPGTEIGEDYYIVKRGDTLYSIAAKNNISISDIKRLNNLESDILTIGQKLLLSEDKLPSGNLETYIVKRGDTLYSISQKYNTTPNILKQINNLTSNSLMIGQQLKVPISDGTTDDVIAEDYTYYTVVRGDSLWSIAKRYQISVEDLIKLNNLININLKIGDVLKIPKSSNSLNTYVVKNGDSLWSIAKANNISVEALKEANNLTSNLLSIGQTLIIPK